MRGKPEVIQALNDLLTAELTAIDVYFIQSRMVENWGYSKIYERFNHEIEDEQGHASKLIERLLFLEGSPDIASRLAFDPGADVPAMFKIGLQLELDVSAKLNRTMTLCEELGDNGTRELLVPLLVDTEEDHILWLETQIRLLEQVGVENYLAEQL